MDIDKALDELKQLIEEYEELYNDRLYQLEYSISSSLLLLDGKLIGKGLTSEQKIRLATLKCRFEDL